MDQSIVYHHCIFKGHNGIELFNKAMPLINKYPAFAVRELEDKGLHYHLLWKNDWDEQKVRREFAKFREKRQREFSYRTWLGTKYLCKGASPRDQPEVIINTLPQFGEVEISQLHDQWWTYTHNTPADPSFKVLKPFHELIEWVKERPEDDLTPQQVMAQLVSIYQSRGGTIALTNRNIAQNYVRTAMLFSKHSDKYRVKCLAYLNKDLY